MNKYILTDSELAKPIIIEANNVSEAENKAREYYSNVIDSWFAAIKLFNANINDINDLDIIN